MSRKGNCYDNAPAESFFATLKRESAAAFAYDIVSDAKADVFRYIEGYYNTVRPHSALGYQSPNERQMLLQQSEAA